VRRGGLGAKLARIKPDPDLAVKGELIPLTAEALAGLIRRVQRGDADAFEPLYLAHVRRIFALCLRMTGDPRLAEELVQDVFVRVWERIPGLVEPNAFLGWLRRLAVNVVFERARTDRRRIGRVVLADDLADGAAESPAGVVEAELGLDLERAIATLPPGARAAFVLHDVEGYTHEEIAQLTGLAAGTLRAQLHRARRLLLERLR
jgi:RNA polymerase sigma-70 factor (ECF subfamily)